MPLVIVSNLIPVLGSGERPIRRMLNTLRRGGWVWSVRRGMTERRQERWFLTRRAADLLYANDHQHAAPREAARAALPFGYSAPPLVDFDGGSHRTTSTGRTWSTWRLRPLLHRRRLRTTPERALTTSTRRGRPPAGEWR